MAEFSKQWCEINDSDMPWDFDIDEVASKLTPEYGLPYICEGFGFTYIAKDEKNNVVLGFPDYITNTIKYTIKWKTYKEVINEL
jgi:hypothetical protein